MTRFVCISTRDTRAKLCFDKLEVLCHLSPKGELNSADITGKNLFCVCCRIQWKSRWICCKDRSIYLCLYVYIYIYIKCHLLSVHQCTVQFYKNQASTKREEEKGWSPMMCTRKGTEEKVSVSLAMYNWTKLKETKLGCFVVNVKETEKKQLNEAKPRKRERTKQNETNARVKRELNVHDESSMAQTVQEPLFMSVRRVVVDCRAQYYRDQGLNQEMTSSPSHWTRVQRSSLMIDSSCLFSRHCSSIDDAEFRSGRLGLIASYVWQFSSIQMEIASWKPLSFRSHAPTMTTTGRFVVISRAPQSRATVGHHWTHS